MSSGPEAFLVTLKADIGEEHAEVIADALRLMRGVVSVKPVEDKNCCQDIADERALDEWRAKIRGVLWPERSGR